MVFLTYCPLPLFVSVVLLRSRSFFFSHSVQIMSVMFSVPDWLLWIRWIYICPLTFVIRIAPKNEYMDPCQPSPCGPNSQCRTTNTQAVCSCSPGFFGSPPGCRPECVVNSECSSNKACTTQKCVDPCTSTCGRNAQCRVINHSPICSCLAHYTGNPFTRCYPSPPRKHLNASVMIPIYFIWKRSQHLIVL